MRERLLAAVFGFFGALALVAIIGWYGVLAYNTMRRRNEMGIRASRLNPMNAFIFLQRDQRNLESGRCAEAGVSRSAASRQYGPED